MPSGTGMSVAVASVVGASGLLLLLWKAMGCLGRRSIRGKVVLITGASSGLGEELAHVFYEAGARLILCARRESELQRVRDDLLSKPRPTEEKNLPEIPILTVDVADLDAIPSKAKTALEFFGHVDILINNAGQSYRGLSSDTELDVHMRLMTVNYFGHVALTKGLLRSMLPRNSGHIVNVSSVQGRIAIPYRSAYGASKHALQAFSDSLRAELCNTRVRITSVCPGYIRTNLSLNALSGDGTNYGAMDASIASGMSSRYVAKRLLAAVQHEENEVVVAPWTNRAAIVIRAVAPTLYFWIMRKRANSQRHGEKLKD